MPSLLEDERFATNELRLENYDSVTPIIKDYFKDKTKAELTEAFNAYKIPNSPVNTIPKLMHNEQLKARNMLVPMHDDGVGDYLAMGNPMMLSETPAVLEKGAPSMGRDTKAVLMEYGYTEDEVNKLAENEVI